MSKGYKGGEFEREVCKQLSRWWTSGERDDIYWRSSQSGGRATQRSKSGKTTFGSYGDIAFVDPIGAPLLELFTIELKRGSSHGCAGDLIDYKKDNSKHQWMRCLKQTIRSHREARSFAWMMIARRDHRQAMAYIDATAFRHLRNRDDFLPRVRFILPLDEGRNEVDFVAVLLENFLAAVSPKEIIRTLTYLQMNHER